MTGSACPPFTQHLGEMVGTARCAFAHPTEFFAALLLNDRGASKRFARRANVPHPDGYCRKPQIRTIIPTSRLMQRGASRSSRTLSAGCDGRDIAADECWYRVRRNRAVLAPRRWRQVGDDASHHADDGGKKARSPGRPRISRKTIAQGMPAVCGVPVVANACAFFLAHAAAGASDTRHSLRPLDAKRVDDLKNSGMSCRENAIP